MKPEIVNINDCEQFITKDGSKIREILSPRNSGIKRQSFAEAVLPVGTATEEHCHHEAEEIYYILEGNGEINIAGNCAVVRKGDGIVLPPGIRHKIYNRGKTELVFSLLMRTTISTFRHNNHRKEIVEQPDTSVIV